MLGSVSGFYASFGDPVYVLVASLTVAVAGSISMAAGVLASSRSQLEVQRVENAKRTFFDPESELMPETRPLSAAMAVRASYLLGALFPILPVLLGAVSPLWSMLVSGIMVALVTMLLSFLVRHERQGSGVAERLLVAVAVAITYGLGTLVKQIWQITV